MNRLNQIQQCSRKKSLKFFLVSLFLATGMLISNGQEITFDNYTGEWSDDASWIDHSAPGNSLDGVSITIFGDITLDDNLTFDNSTITIYDTLVISGNLNLLNNADLFINSSGILIVLGDYYSENKVEVLNNGKLIVAGDFTMVGSDNQGSFTNTGAIYIFDDTPEIKSGTGYTDLLCPDPNDYPANCGYGNETDLEKDPVYDFYLEVICRLNDTISPILALPVLPPVESIADIPPVYENYTAMVNDGGIATDNCSINENNFSHVSDISDNNSCPEIITRTYSISDKAGNITNASQFITIKDNTAPELFLPVIPNLHCIGNVPEPYNNLSEILAAGGSATDNIGIDTSSFILANEDTFAIGAWTAVSRKYEISDHCGNWGSATQDILINDVILPYITCPGDIIICAEDTSGAVINNIEPVSYSDNCTPKENLMLSYTIVGTTVASGQGDASGIFFNKGMSTVTYTVTDESGNASSGSFNVTVNPRPFTPDITGTGSLPCEASGQVYSIASDSNSYFHWTVPSDAIIITDTSGYGSTDIEVNFGFNGGYITVIETNSYGCTGDTKNLEVDLTGCSLTADFIMDRSSLCKYDSVTVWSTSTGVSAHSSFSWNFGTEAQPSVATGPGPHTIRYNSAGVKNIELIVEEGSANTKSRTIEVHNAPQGFLGPDREICEGDSFIFTPDISCTDYLWHNGSTESEYIASNSEIVSVNVVDINGCSGSDTSELTVRSNPIIDLGPDREVCSPEGEELSAGEFAFYEWSTGDHTESVIVYSGEGDISLKVTDWFNCTASDEITILPCNNINSIIEIPGIISPNGDGIDDTWFIPDLELYPDAYILIFDMFGRKIFQTNGNSFNTWDGSYNGKQMPAGRYFYIIDIKSSGIQPISGSVTLIR